ncbi:MAG: NAD(P)/FAD-dependent oxidoreductase, partial [Bacteroidia bacterium]
SHRKAIEAVWYTGKLMAPILAKTICKEKTKYVQGVWFNSAKFFDIEYQVYGEISPTPQAHETHLYWEHSDGKKAIRIVYDTIHRNVLGFNLMGIRYRQEICEQWISQRANIEVVLKNLSQANFDPEFFKKYEGELLKSYQNK